MVLESINPACSQRPFCVRRIQPDNPLHEFAKKAVNTLDGRGLHSSTSQLNLSRF